MSEPRQRDNLPSLPASQHAVDGELGAGALHGRQFYVITNWLSQVCEKRRAGTW